MGYSVYVTGKSPSGGIDTADATALAEALAPYLSDFSWEMEDFDPNPEWCLSEDEWSVSTKIGYDEDHFNRQVAQILAAALICSRARPDWTFEVEDDLAALDVEGKHITLEGGQFTHGRESAEDYITDELDFVKLGITSVKHGDQEFEIDTTFLNAPAPVESAAPAVPTAPMDLKATYTVEPDATAVRVMSWSIGSEPTDDAGDTKIVFEAIVFNALSESVALGVVFDVVDANGALVESYELEEERLIHEGERVPMGGGSWLFGRGVPEGATVVVRAFRKEAVLVSLGQITPSYRPPDDDGDVRFDIRFEIENEGPTFDEGEAHIFWVDADGERTRHATRESFRVISTGLSAHHVWGYLRDEQLSVVGFDATVDLQISRTQTVSIVDGGLPRVVVAAPIPHVPERPAARPEPAAVTPVVAEPTPAPEPTPTPEPAPAPEPVPAAPADLADELRSGDDDRIVAACTTIQADANKSHATRVRGLLKSPSPAVRAAAAACLGTVGGLSLVIPLRALLQDADASVREAAEAAIASLQG